MALTDSKRRANNKYIAEHMTVLGCKVTKERAERFKQACAAAGTNPNKEFNKVIDAMLKETPSD